MRCSRSLAHWAAPWQLGSCCVALPQGPGGMGGLPGTLRLSPAPGLLWANTAGPAPSGAGSVEADFGQLCLSFLAEDLDQTFQLFCI